jgi:GNAT superfamily N-acetyltransferase
MTNPATPSVPAPTFTGSHRRSDRDNVRMPGVSQALLEFAQNYRAKPQPGVDVFATPRYQITLQPDFPVPGPNSVSFIRCSSDEADDVIREARATIAPYRLPVMWILDPGTEPPGFAEHLARLGILPDPHGFEFAALVLPIDATMDGPAVPGLEFLDPLADLATFRKMDAVAAEAFQAGAPGDDPQTIAMQERRRRNFIAAGNRRFLLATIDSEPAGASNVALFPPTAATVNGGSVRPKFRGRGIYRAMVAERLRIAREAGVEGLVVWAGDMSGPILEKLGFQKVGWRRFYLDPSATT